MQLPLHPAQITKIAFYHLNMLMFTVRSSFQMSSIKTLESSWHVKYHG